MDVPPAEVRHPESRPERQADPQAVGGLSQNGLPKRVSGATSVPPPAGGSMSGLAAGTGNAGSPPESRPPYQRSGPQGSGGGFTPAVPAGATPSGHTATPAPPPWLANGTVPPGNPLASTGTASEDMPGKGMSGEGLSGGGPAAAGMAQARLAQPPLADQTPFDAFRLPTAPPAAPASPAGSVYGGSAQVPTSPAPSHPPFTATPSSPDAPPLPATPPPPRTQPSASEPEPPIPQIRKGRVLLAVMFAAVLLLVVPLGIVWLATRPGTPSFDVGTCVRRAGSEAVAAQCDEPGAHRVVAKVDSPDKCTDPPGQPYVVISGGGKENVLCLGPEASE